jgi:hypothetical protein
MTHLELQDVKCYEGNKIIFSDMSEDGEISIGCLDVDDKEINLFLPKEDIIVLRDYLTTILSK